MSLEPATVSTGAPKPKLGTPIVEDRRGRKIGDDGKPVAAVEVPGDFSPATIGVPNVTVALEGGPYGGRESRVLRGAASVELTFANSNPEIEVAFVNVHYARTKRRNDDGLAVFEFKA